MATPNNIQAELKEIAPAISAIARVNPFEVPAGYFEFFASGVMMRIKTEGLSSREETVQLSSLLGGLSRQVPFETPDGYFGELSEQAVSGVKAIDLVNRELENLSPVMSQLRSVNVYETPVGYFDSLAGEVLQRIKEHRPARVVMMNMGKKVMRLAVAAAITAVMAIGGWMYFGNQEKSVTGLASIEKKVHQLNEDEMVTFLENSGGMAGDVSINTNDQIDESDVKTLLANVSDQELEQFLKENNETNTLSN